MNNCQYCGGPERDVVKTEISFPECTHKEIHREPKPHTPEDCLRFRLSTVSQELKSLEDKTAVVAPGKPATVEVDGNARAKYDRLRAAVNGTLPRDLEFLDSLQADNARLSAELASLRAAREAELGVCESKCEVVAKLAAELQQARPFMEAITCRHNGYDAEARKAMPTQKEPATPEQAIDELCDEAAGLARAEMSDELAKAKAENERMRAVAVAIVAYQLVIGHYYKGKWKSSGGASKEGENETERH